MQSTPTQRKHREISKAGDEFATSCHKRRTLHAVTTQNTTSDKGCVRKPGKILLTNTIVFHF